MSQENVEIVKAQFDAWNAGDMDAVRELLDPDTVWQPPDDWPETGPFVGREAVMRQWEQLRDTWDADSLEPTSDFIDIGDRVVVSYIWRGAGHGPESSIAATSVYTVRSGKISRQEVFWDHGEALKAVGLAEQAMPGESTTPDLEEDARRRLAALSRGDFDTAIAGYAPDAVWNVSPMGLEGVFEGRDAIRGAWEDLVAPYDHHEVVFDEYRYLGNGVTLAVLLFRGRPRGSSRFIEGRTASVATWANGLIERLTSYTDIDEARAAAERLAEERAQADV